MHHEPHFSNCFTEKQGSLRVEHSVSGGFIGMEENPVIPGKAGERAWMPARPVRSIDGRPSGAPWPKPAGGRDAPSEKSVPNKKGVPVSRNMKLSGPAGAGRNLEQRMKSRAGMKILPGFFRIPEGENGEQGGQWAAGLPKAAFLLPRNGVFAGKIPGLPIRCAGIA